MLWVLADLKTLAWNVTFSKLCAAEIALVNNFVWNEFWTFRGCRQQTKVYDSGRTGSESNLEDADRYTATHCLHLARLHRFLVFNAICGIGIVFATILLHLFYTVLDLNLYLSNFLAIGLVTMWNFGINARFNWRSSGLHK